MLPTVVRFSTKIGLELKAVTLSDGTSGSLTAALSCRDTTFLTALRGQVHPE